MSNGETSKPSHLDSKPPAKERELQRREMLTKMGVGIVGVALGAPVLMSVRSLVPNALYEQPQRFKAGKLELFAEGPTFISDQRVFIFREQQTFYCLSAVCTHLGCTVQLVRTGNVGNPAEDFEFHCPCHGSKFNGEGTNYEGPAPKPLDYFKLELSPDDGQLIVDMSQVADKVWRFSV
jgi:menaquinol-cytochrome c reductase iron-sulfur subunit